MEQKKELIKMSKNKNMIILCVIIASIIVIDQIIKIIIANIGDITIFPGILQLKIQENVTGAYGVNSNSSMMYVLTNLVVLAVVFKFMRMENEFVTPKMKVFLSFVLAGGISNVIDRIFRGYVLEYIDFTAIANIPIFNLADIFVIIGWICMVAIFASFTVTEWRSHQTKK